MFQLFKPLTHFSIYTLSKNRKLVYVTASTGLIKNTVQTSQQGSYYRQRDSAIRIHCKPLMDADQFVGKIIRVGRKAYTVTQCVDGQDFDTGETVFQILTCTPYGGPHVISPSSIKLNNVPNRLILEAKQ